MKTHLRIGAAGVLAVAVLGIHTTAADKKEPDKAALERTREQVQMLDDLYKTAVVSVTAHYGDKQAAKPAIFVANDVFAAMKKKGYHTARLVDATGDPKSDANIAKTEFEKKAIQAIKGGKSTYEEVGEADGKPVLRTATIVPAVMKACAKCHGVKENDLLGAIVYELPIK
ncbi:c-type heme family protein [Limnoglobus roseus]|uniref:Tll0287-like domain-containing protein n=1 Tax=Limnoglobus roseus TaxID=2598579 RepID=A0A5C1A9E1_9BACT|nr:DUF3365 domain-containing protein [Limnoglobus roseus]QEL13688.1 hypothetical protein PX52LOC_00546 [Limnoglobus roseus]